MKEIIEKLRDVIDSDIIDFILEIVQSYKPNGGEEKYQRWELVNDPIMTIMKWQELRYKKYVK